MLINASVPLEVAAQLTNIEVEFVRLAQLEQLAQNVGSA